MVFFQVREQTMAYLKFQRVSFRDRGIYIPFEEKVPIRDELEEHRMHVLATLRNTLHDAWRSFASEHVNDVPVVVNSGEMLSDFLSVYAAMLWKFKRVRKQKDTVTKYALSIRISNYDKVFQVWKHIANLWDDRFLNSFEFEDRLINTVLVLGKVMRELELIGGHQMNAAEYIIKRKLHQKKAVSIRHFENHALRNEVYTWADKNIKLGMSLDSAASELAGKVVPLKWRTVREHLTAWKKQRSASTP